MNWAFFALGVTAVLALVWIAAALRVRPAWPGWVAGAALLLVGALNTAAPVRGAIDPNYVGYSFGYVSADRGLSVTLAAGAVLVLALVGAFAALGRSPVARILVAIASLAFLVNLGAPLMLSAAEDIDANTIQFGEYLTIPGVVAAVLTFALGVVPFAIGLWWSVRPQPAR